MIKGLSPPGPSGAAETKLAVAKTLLKRVFLSDLQVQLGFSPAVKNHVDSITSRFLDRGAIHATGWPSFWALTISTGTGNVPRCRWPGGC